VCVCVCRCVCVYVYVRMRANACGSVQLHHLRNIHIVLAVKAKGFSEWVK